MKVWVIGGTGMLGFALHGALGARGHTVLSSGSDVDIGDPAALARFFDQLKPTHIILCAAHTGVDLCESEQAKAVRLNAVGPRNVAELAAARGAYAVHVSTDYVFKGDATTPYAEDAATDPQCVYGTTKRDGERAFLAALPSGAVVRTSWLYGPRGKNFVQTMLRLMKEKDELKVVADQRGRPTFTFDLAEALVDVCEQRLAGTYHWANTGETTWHGFANAIREGALARGLPVKARVIHGITTAEYPTPAKRPAYSVLATGKLEAALGKPARSWEKALDSYLNAVKDGLA
jgi:dTDP-4-dehydrorhamnose reductase